MVQHHRRGCEILAYQRVDTVVHTQRVEAIGIDRNADQEGVGVELNLSPDFGMTGKSAEELRRIESEFPLQKKIDSKATRKSPLVYGENRILAIINFVFLQSIRPQKHPGCGKRQLSFQVIFEY